VRGSAKTVEAAAKEVARVRRIIDTASTHEEMMEERNVSERVDAPILDGT
jgi:hypothetical protein